ncbi:MAG: hypothetical protein BGP16_15070 [Sphingobium sp. 66-54]|nr:MAG: hypothetical protein BGP16_15070 [Sphingobium sp. 66-54]
MTPEALYTHDGLTEFRALSVTASACQEAFDYLDGCIADGLTLEEAALYAVDRCGPLGNEFWFWVRTEMRAMIAVNFRVMLTDLITRDNPRMAAHVDIYFNDLNETEIQMVTSRWTAEDLPNIARQLASGIVTRARENGDD